MHRATFLELPFFDHLHRFLPALYQQQGARAISVPVNHRPRTRGRSKYGRLWVGIVDLFGVMWLRSRAKPGLARPRPERGAAAPATTRNDRGPALLRHPGHVARPRGQAMFSMRFIVQSQRAPEEERHPDGLLVPEHRRRAHAAPLRNPPPRSGVHRRGHRPVRVPAQCTSCATSGRRSWRRSDRGRRRPAERGRCAATRCSSGRGSACAIPGRRTSRASRSSATWRRRVRGCSRASAATCTRTSRPSSSGRSAACMRSPASCGSPSCCRRWWPRSGRCCWSTISAGGSGRAGLGLDITCTKIAVDFQNLTRGGLDTTLRECLELLRSATGCDVASWRCWRRPVRVRRLVIDNLHFARGPFAQCQIEALTRENLAGYRWLLGRLDPLRLSEIRDTSRPRPEQQAEAARFAELRIGAWLAVGRACPGALRRAARARARAAARTGTSTCSCC
jgi:hypothetical protein